MAATLTVLRDTSARSVREMMQNIGQRARDASDILADASSGAKNHALRAAARLIRERASHITDANDLDIKQAETLGLTNAAKDKLKLNQKRIEAMARGLEEISELPDPVGEVLASWERPNGLNINRIRVPLGVIGIIYESRPNVTADAAGLCIKSGNASILRCGSESLGSCLAIMECIAEGLAEAGLPVEASQMVPTVDRAAVGELLQMSDFVDVIVPRGGRSLLERVKNESRIPLFLHLDGICHTYVHEDSDVDMAREIVLNAKMRRTGVCGATETLLVDRSLTSSHLPLLVNALLASNCEVRGDSYVQGINSAVIPATEKDWSTEYLDAVISIKTVAGADEAIAHINKYGSHHTDSIITNDDAVASQFLRRVNSAIVLRNASTQFADGGEFGMGAEIGISTGKMHARGPVGVEQLTTFKYVVLGTGQCRQQ